MAASAPSSATHVTLSNGASMPLVGLGTWKSAAGAVRAAVISALESGYRHIDCAAAYGNEGEVGEGLADCFARGVCKREDVFVTSKLWVASSFPDTVATALAKTLADLRLTYLDLYLVHWPFRIAKGSEFPAPPENRLGYDEAAYAAVWVEMERAVDAGFTRAIGCSNMTARKLSALLKTARIRPAVNQCESHPFLAQAKEIAWLKAHGIAFTAYSPLGSPDRPARLIEESDPAPLHEPAVLAIAAKHGKEPAQVLIRWQVQRGVVVIPKSTTPARIASNIDVFSFDLDSADIEALAALDSGRRLIKGLPWLWLPEQTWQSLWDEDFQY